MISLNDNTKPAETNWAGLHASRPYVTFRSNFPSCSESAEIWHVYSFCVKKCPCICFFKNAERYGQNCVKFNPPPPPLLCPSPNNVGFRSLRVKTLCVCLLRYWRGGGLSKRVWSLVSLLVEQKIQGHFFTEKESACQISADSEQLGKSLRNSHIRPACTEPLN